MKLIFVFLILSCAHAQVTPTGIPLDSDWKVALNSYAIKNVVHPSWGYSHGERNYHQTKLIAENSGIAIDEEVLFASAFLHDLGGLKGFEHEGIDHGVRSAELASPLLKSWGFPTEKIPLVLEVIIGHVYYGPRPKSDLAQAFRDADMLDFLGSMGIARLIAATVEMGEPVSISNSISSIHGMRKKLPLQFSYRFSKKEGEKRIKESEMFLKNLEQYSFKGEAY